MTTEVSTHTPDPEDIDLRSLGAADDDDASNDDTSNDGEEGASSTQDDDIGGASDADVRFAKDNGWTPRAQWRGDPEKYETAQAFADRARGINRLLKRQLEARDREIEEIKRDVADFKAMQVTAAKGTLEKKLTDLRAQRVQAINDGDGATVDSTEREIATVEADIAKLTPAAPEKKTSAQPTLSDEDREFAVSWRSENAWIDDDPKLGRIAKVVGAEIREERPELVGNVRAFLTELTARIKRDYKELFPQMRTNRTTAGDPPRKGPRNEGKKTFEMLPKDAQETCDRLIKRGIVKKREDYVKQYFDAYGA